jgi:hypothetical protein
LFDDPPRRRAVHIIRESLHILLDAYYRFNRDDGWAIASHIGLSILMSVFPFLIVVTAIAGFIGSVDLADEVASLLLEAWPDEVAGPLATEIHHVLTTPHGGLVTIGGVFALYFSSTCSRSAAASLKPQNVALLHAGHGGRNIAIAGDERLTNPTPCVAFAGALRLGIQRAAASSCETASIEAVSNGAAPRCGPSTERSARRSG